MAKRIQNSSATENAGSAANLSCMKSPADKITAALKLLFRAGLRTRQ